MNIRGLKEPKNEGLSRLYNLKYPRNMVVQNGTDKKIGYLQDDSQKDEQHESSSRNNSAYQERKGNKSMKKKKF